MKCTLSALPSFKSWKYRTKHKCPVWWSCTTVKGCLLNDSNGPFPQFGTRLELYPSVVCAASAAHDVSHKFTIHVCNDRRTPKNQLRQRFVLSTKRRTRTGSWGRSRPLVRTIFRTYQRPLTAITTLPADINISNKFIGAVLLAGRI